MSRPQVQCSYGTRSVPTTLRRLTNMTQLVGRKQARAGTARPENCTQVETLGGRLFRPTYSDGLLSHDHEYSRIYLCGLTS